MEEKSKIQADFEKKHLVDSKNVYKGRTITVKVDTYKDEKGTQRSYDIVEHPGAVVAVPILHTGEIVLVKQWRRACQKILLELPAGTLEDGESAIECMDRELQEEIGYKANTLLPLGGFYSAPGFCEEYLYLFIAKKLEPSIKLADEDEAIDVVVLSLDEALKMIDQNLIIDVKTIGGILRYERWQKLNPHL